MQGIAGIKLGSIHCIVIRGIGSGNYIDIGMEVNQSIILNNSLNVVLVSSSQAKL